MRFAAIFAGLMCLWPLFAMLGGQGFTPLLGLAAIAALFYQRRPERLHVYFPASAALVLWIAVTGLWSPTLEGDIFTGRLSEGNFAISYSPARIFATWLAASLVLVAALRTRPATSPRAGILLLAIFSVHALMLLALPLFLQAIYAVAYDTPTEALRDGTQNALRFLNAFVLISPILFAGLVFSGRIAGLSGIIGLIGIAGISLYLGGSAALMGLVFAAAAAGVVAIWPRNGFRVLIGGLVFFVATAPFLLGQAAEWVAMAGLEPPASFQSRLWAWETVTNKILDKPILGYGMEASFSWRETYATQPEWLAEIVSRGGEEAAWMRYPIVPSHPHNMALELWVETGLIGVILTLAFLVSLAWRLPQPSELSGFLRFGAAGLIGSSFSLFAFAYSAWNEAYWSALVLGLTALILIDKSRPQTSA